MSSSSDRIKALEEQLQLMVQYLDLRRSLRDWHGVMDAAADIREIEAKLSELRNDQA